MKTVLRMAILMVVLLLAGQRMRAQSLFSPDHMGEVNMGEVKFGDTKKGVLRFVNRGSEPLHIDSIHKSCGCVSAEVREAGMIDPEMAGHIDVVFEGEMLGFFERYMLVYANDQKEPHVVYCQGRVVKDLAGNFDDYPFDLGNVRMDADRMDFGVVHKGDKVERKLNIYNVSTSAYRPVFSSMPPYIGFKSDPEVLAPQRLGTVTITLDADKMPSLGPQQDVFYLMGYTESVETEGRIRFRVLLTQDFSRMTAEQRLNAPHAVLSDTVLTFGHWGKKGKQTQKVTITNTGKSDLEIHALQKTTSQVDGLILKDKVVKPGKKTKLEVTVRKEDISKKEDVPCEIVFVTNSPDLPAAFIHVNFEE